MDDEFYIWIALDLIARRLEEEGSRKAKRARRKANKALIRAGGTVLEI